MSDDRKEVPAAVERAILRSLARAAEAQLTGSRTWEPQRSRRLTAAAAILSALSDGDMDAAHEAMEALAPRKVRRARKCGGCVGLGDGGCSVCGFTGEVVTWE
jgi:acyl-CoA reductase-like NAD-dependent aldehyde dehydrogenase